MITNGGEFESDGVGVDLTIGGVKVRFPYKPYPAQTVLMSKIIAGCKNSQNCLLESPTGSGKTLALLCAALAWQADEYVKKRKYDAENLAIQMQAVNDGTKDCDSCECGVKVKVENEEVLSDDDDDVMVIGEDDEDDFKPEIKKPTPKKILTEVKLDQNSSMFQCECGCHCSIPKQTTQYQVPKIYYGTRTHKQIAQLTSELGKTAYRHVRMDILASREHTCINEAVVRSGLNKNEECRKLAEAPGGGACMFKVNHQKLGDYDKLAAAGVNSAWDLETFVDVARTKGACPYFATRELFSKADIVFCPYSYLIDPFVRSSMGIELKRDIVIFDEAHNIEDACREAASLLITSREMEEVEKGFRGTETQMILDALNRLKNYINEEGSKINESDVSGQMICGPIHSGAMLVAHLENRLGLDHATCVQLSMDLAQLVNAKQEEETIESQRKSKKSDSAISSKLENVLGGLLGVIDFIQRDGNKHAEDFRMLVSKQQVMVEDNGTPQARGWLGRRKGGGGGGGYHHEIVYSLHFWCMNPAIVFSSVVENARCIVLASGTLSPMNTFQSELGTTFPIQFEAGHVIGKNQVFAAAIGQTPSGKTLQATYKFTETFEFQDGIGELTEEVCQVTPGGVLLFFTSYRLIEKMVDRWKSTGLYNRIAAMKRIFVESSGAGAHFEETLAEFYASCGKPAEPDNEEVITDEDEDSSTQSSRFFGSKPLLKKRKIDEFSGGKRRMGVTPMSQRSKTVGNYKPNSGFFGSSTGALFLAVYRGKVSEGLNFADEYARAVIAVGIPYPALKDPQVQEKRTYNEMHCKTRQILAGGEWYECQAFRALNQALGRCIRHRKDWGAIILCDERFTIPKLRCNDKVSKWVRERRVMYSSFPMFRKNLIDFIQSEKFEGVPQTQSTQQTAVTSTQNNITPIAKQYQPLPVYQHKTPPVQIGKFSFTPTAQAKLAAQSNRPMATAIHKQQSNFQNIPQQAVVEDSNSPVQSSSASPEVSEPICQPERSSSCLSDLSPMDSKVTIGSIIGKSTGVPVFQMLPPIAPPNQFSGEFRGFCYCCHEEFFFGAKYTMQSNCGEIPAFISKYFSQSSRKVPESFEIGDPGSYGVRGNNGMFRALDCVEGIVKHVQLKASAPNCFYDPEDSVSYESYYCKCRTTSSSPIDVLCWTIVGIQPGRTSPAIANLLNKAIFNPYAGKLEPLMLDD